MAEGISGVREMVQATTPSVSPCRASGRGRVDGAGCCLLGRGEEGRRETGAGGREAAWPHYPHRPGHFPLRPPPALLPSRQPESVIPVVAGTPRARCFLQASAHPATLSHSLENALFRLVLPKPVNPHVWTTGPQPQYSLGAWLR